MWPSVTTASTPVFNDPCSSNSATASLRLGNPDLLPQFSSMLSDLDLGKLFDDSEFGNDLAASREGTSSMQDQFPSHASWGSVEGADSKAGPSNSILKQHEGLTEQERELMLMNLEGLLMPPGSSPQANNGHRASGDGEGRHSDKSHKEVKCKRTRAREDRFSALEAVLAAKQAEAAQLEQQNALLRRRQRILDMFVKARYAFSLDAEKIDKRAKECIFFLEP